MKKFKQNLSMAELKDKMKREKWYGSRAHFNTEKSYEEHLEDLQEKKKNKLKLKVNGMLSFNDLMKM